MYLKDKNVLVLGLGITGISAVRALSTLGANIKVWDAKIPSEDTMRELDHIPLEKHLVVDTIDLNDIDLIVKSPGIPPRMKIIQDAAEKNIEIITDLELAYRISATKNFIAITGTNGKTTCTVLLGEILKTSGLNTHVVGNIGTGILDKIIDSDKEDYFVIEASSFQLENTVSFRPKSAMITNITPDHLDWHGGFDSYRDAKMKIYKNQEKDDFLILNYDDEILRNIHDSASNILYFSRREILKKGIYVLEEEIVINDGEKIIPVINPKDLKILGNHNLENALACIGVAYSLNIDIDIIKCVLKDFAGVEHRIEYAGSKNEIKFYNDSKGTNVDASIKAIEAMEGDTILIAGGFDKGIEFHSLIEAFNNKIKALVLLGETKDKIKKTAQEYGYDNIYEVESIEEAVNISYELGSAGNNVLLSPACASWDMYKCYEERGNDFKLCVSKLME